MEKDNARKRRNRRRRRPVLNVQVGRELTSPYDEALDRLFGRLRENPDQTLKDHSTEGLRLYNEMIRKDSQLAMCFRMRSLSVTAQGWRVIPAGKSDEDIQLADWVRDTFSEIDNFHLSRTRFMRGISHGFAPAEVIYSRRLDGTIGVEAFRNRDPERFRFDDHNSLVLVGYSGSEDKTMPAEKFLLNSWGSDETPYGEGLLQQLYPLWFFKNNAIKELVRFIEKFGAPYLWANYPTGTPADQQDALLDVLKRMQANSVGIGPENTEIKISEVSRQGVIEVFRFIIEEYVDRQYAKAILGQTLSTESESGTHALANFQSRSLQHILEDDCLWQQEQLNRLVRFLIDLNFGSLPVNRYPQFRIPYEEEQDIKDYLSAVDIAVNELGLRVGEKWLRDQVGFPAPGEDEAVLSGKISERGNREDQ